MKYITYAFFLILIFYNIRNKRSKSQKVVKSQVAQKQPQIKLWAIFIPPSVVAGWTLGSVNQDGNSPFQYTEGFGDSDEDFIGAFQRR